MAASNSQHHCVFVGNIPYDATEEQLVQICEEVGPVVSLRLVIDKETGKPKGYGFCEYKDGETALSACRNLQGYEINGRLLRVNFAENDKASVADRNREQGRGGPGLLSSVDPQKQIGSLAILGDSALHQPIGISVSATAASGMAGALCNAQNGVMSPQNGLRDNQLTHYLAKMSRNQMFEIMSEMKLMATQNKELARQLLLSSPQLRKALFQAQIMVGMVTPQNIRQLRGSLLQPPPLQEDTKDHKLALFPPLLSHQNFQPSSSNSMMQPSVPESVSKFAERSAQDTADARNSTYPNTSLGLLEQKRRMGDASDNMNHPWKMARLGDGRDARSMVNQQTSGRPGAIQVVGTGSSSANMISNTEGMQYPEKQALQAPDDEPALLEQVMNLTPEQLSSLTLEQRQQVMQLQKLLGNR